MNLELKKFDMSKIKDNSVVVLIGKRDTGKSFLCRDILHHHRSIPVGQVISGTEGEISFINKLFQNYSYMKISRLILYKIC